MLVCLICGSNEFEQTRYAQVRVVMQCDAGSTGFREFYDVDEEITDGGDRDGDIVCADCGRDTEPEDLVPEDEFNAESEI